MKTVFASLLLAGSLGTSFAIAACSSDDNTSAPTTGTTGTDASTGSGNDASTGTTGTGVDSGTGTTTGDDSGTGTATTDAGDTASIARGAALVTTNGCASATCHGSDLGGDILEPNGNYSANITFSTTAGLGEPPAWTETDISNALRNHVDKTGAALCAPMPVFDSTTIPDQGVEDIYNYLKSVPPSSKVKPNTDCNGNPLDGG